jgi:hypothetical protein
MPNFLQIIIEYQLVLNNRPALGQHMLLVILTRMEGRNLLGRVGALSYLYP